MRKPFVALAGSLVLGACAPPNVQQYAGFRRAALAPGGATRPVGQLVAFNVLPPVAKGTHWSLESHGLARFVGDDAGHTDWIADRTPIRMEMVVAPWPLRESAARKNTASRRGWLSFGMGDGADAESLDLDLPVNPLPYRELTPVTYASAFSVEPRKTRLSFETKGTE